MIYFCWVLTILLVEHKDRLTRVGFNYLETLLNKLDKKIEVVNSVDTDEKDIIQDFISIITSYTARIYGKRWTKRKTAELIKELKRKSKEDDI
jgi:predicted site-specific integrase-resolvase